jgi:phosphatidylglycerophosphatase C
MTADETGDGPVQRGPDTRPVVAVDFDGTMTRRDTLRVFLVHLGRRSAVVGAFARHLPEIARSVRGDAFRDRAKEAVFADILGGMPRADADAAARATADAVMASLLKPDVVARLRWHQGQGHRLIVVSASFAGYVDPVAASLGIREVIATRWEVDTATDRLTGRFADGNVRGAAKVRRLEAHLGGPARLAYAYGNSSGDVAMLAAAETPVWIRRAPISEAPA